MASNPWNSLPKALLEDLEFQNYVKSHLAMVRLRDALVAPTERIMKEFVAAKITPGETCAKCTPDNIKGAKGSRCTICQPRVQSIMSQAGTHGGAKAQINWSNSDPRKWNTHYWEVAKCYLGPGQKDSSGPETTDCANIITLWLNCGIFTPLCLEKELLEKIRVISNKLVHSPDMKQSADEMAAVFESIKGLLNDENLRTNPDVDCQTVIAELESIRDKSSAIFTELNKVGVVDNLIKQLRDNVPSMSSELTSGLWKDQTKQKLAQMFAILSKLNSELLDDKSEQRQLAEVAETDGFNYTIGKQIGFGACARVYNCNENAKLAIKKVEIGPDPSNETLELIRNEIEKHKGLKHERVVHYIANYKTETEVCLVMEKMTGGSLFQYLKKHGAFDENRCRKYVLQALAGLEYLHKENIIHRDLKGANILLDESGDIKLCDFGLAKLMECSTMHAKGGANSFVGTAHWMAPEVAKGEHYGRKCDIWSLGCTFVEMLTTTPPWPGLGPNQVIFKIGMGKHPKYEPPAALSEAARDFLELCFKINPKERPSAAELMHHRFVTGTSISPHVTPSCALQ